MGIFVRPSKSTLKLRLSVGGRRPVLVITVEATERSLTLLGCMSPEVAQMRSADRIDLCLSLEVKQKTSALDEYFAF
jgi:hypothetical protein